MTKFRRVLTFLSGLFTILFGILMLCAGSNGLLLIASVIGASICIYAIRMLSYYSGMARHMVDGKITLYLGIVALCLGIFTLSLIDGSEFLLIMYLIGLYIFNGGVELMRGLESKKYKAPGWIRKIIYGGVCIVIGIISLVAGLFFRSLDLLVYLYAVALFISGGIRIGQAFKRTAVVYIS